MLDDLNLSLKNHVTPGVKIVGVKPTLKGTFVVNFIMAIALEVVFVLLRARQ